MIIEVLIEEEDSGRKVGSEIGFESDLTQIRELIRLARVEPQHKDGKVG